MTSSVTRVVFSKFIAWVAFFLLGCYFLFPNLLKKETDNRFALSNILLGIDLQGGTYITLGVDLDKALDGYLETRSKALFQFLKEQKLPTPLDRSLHNGVMTLTFSEAMQAEKVYSAVRSEQEIMSLIACKLEGKQLKISLPAAQAKALRGGIVTQAVEVLKQRIVGKGMLLDASIQAHGSRQIVVQIPATDDDMYERLKKLLTQRAHLEFKMIKAVAGSKKALEDKYDGEIPASLMAIPGNSKSGYDQSAREWYLVERYADLSGEHVQRANATHQQGENAPVVEFVFDAQGARTFAELTSENTGQSLGIVIDDVVFSAPTIRQAITEGRGVISGGRGFSWEEARDLAHVLNTGSFQAPIRFEEERRIGPSLGQDSIQRGLVSCLVGLLLVFLFSIFFYRLAGLFAMCALGYNLFLILLFLSWFRATLTLPGIAGMVLTIGMAIDASILIFEKVREEVTNGVAFRRALHDGFRGAMVVIFDSNLTTLGTGVILYYLGGPSIQGFAITLMLGIVATMLAGVFFLRSMFDFTLDNTKISRFHL